MPTLPRGHSQHMPPQPQLVRSALHPLVVSKRLKLKYTAFNRYLCKHLLDVLTIEGLVT